MTEFVDTVPDLDSVPELDAVEYPCRTCGREAGPYSGRGPKPKLCPDHKSTSRAGEKNRAPRVTGNTANLAAQATGVLVQLNAILAMGAAAMGLFRTGGAIAAANEGFEQAAYRALLTDEALCKAILKTGSKSAKVALGLAYGSLGMAVAPTAIEEFKERKAEREAKRVEAESDGGYRA